MSLLFFCFCVRALEGLQWLYLPPKRSHRFLWLPEMLPPASGTAASLEQAGSGPQAAPAALSTSQSGFRSHSYCPGMSTVPSCRGTGCLGAGGPSRASPQHGSAAFLKVCSSWRQSPGPFPAPHLPQFLCLQKLRPRDLVGARRQDRRLCGEVRTDAETAPGSPCDTPSCGWAPSRGQESNRGRQRCPASFGGGRFAPCTRQVAVRGKPWIPSSAAGQPRGRLGLCLRTTGLVSRPGGLTGAFVNVLQMPTGKAG